MKMIPEAGINPGPGDHFTPGKKYCKMNMYLYIEIKGRMGYVFLGKPILRQ